MYHDADRRLALVKAIVTTKIHNQHAVLYRHGHDENSLKLQKKLVQEQTTLDQVRGVEGIAIRRQLSNQALTHFQGNSCRQWWRITIVWMHHF
ncbi:CRISPR-associated endonuclease Cas1 [Phormidesmis priestleyi]